ncbi:type VI secretion system baseplate subunit TssK [Paraburkholderia sp. D15]|uniref:type VI secretion system baseplate subunit TssK n=1 Tax=Paraburkholderia sp. D15 TaxID=2880218 RepID=UPI00247A6260|nr:type VI secretion system baseplate subunit TssK [Paraburkholderia sp. D15]WGS49454.1 type VI secretion system baseplate subunit TssK [Paraburkholderia sp. D15]
MKHAAAPQDLTQDLPSHDSGAARARVVWSEGMYLRPQHFQQFERYMESYVQLRCRATQRAYWGFVSIAIDHDALALGKVALTAAQGVFPDGTPFLLTDPDDLPAPLDIPLGATDQLVLLAFPVKRPGGEETIFDEERADSLARYRAYTRDIADGNAVALGPASVQLARARLRLVLASGLGGAWQALGVLRVVERRSDNHLVLDPHYIPPMLSAGQHPLLAGYIRELHGLLEQRGDALAQRLSRPGRGGVAEVADFLLLALVNRAQADTWHEHETGNVHPEALFQQWLRLAFDLATYTTAERRPTVRPRYRHDDLQHSFAPLMTELRRALSTVLEQNAVAIELQERAHRVWVARIPSPDLLHSAGFVLAVHADLPAETVRTRFPAQVKIGPAERLADLVNLHLPGIALRMLPVAPRQIPYHAGYHYFELDRGAELWKQLDKSSGLALHVAGELPGLAMACWAIRG